VVGNSPLPAFVDVEESVPGLHLGSISAHGEFVDACILAPVDALGDLALDDGSGWLLL